MEALGDRAVVQPLDLLLGLELLAKGMRARAAQRSQHTAQAVGAVPVRLERRAPRRTAVRVASVFPYPFPGRRLITRAAAGAVFTRLDLAAVRVAWVEVARDPTVQTVQAERLIRAAAAAVPQGFPVLAATAEAAS
jgi:hypothetical protein